LLKQKKLKPQQETEKPSTDNSENAVREKIIAIAEEEMRRLLRLLIVIQSNYSSE
jgi:hypothetical protein